MQENTMKNYSPKVSIILPTYNVEKYIQECLESIDRQTYSNCEVIIIVDGAKDNSFNIAKEFCSVHDKFSVYWQENAGSGPARNNGIERASGELIMFIDPDDYIEPDYIENMVNEQQDNNFDLVTTLGIDYYYNEDNRIASKHVPTIETLCLYNQSEVRQHYVDLFCKGFLHAPHSRVYKKSIIDKFQLRFPDLRRSQDIVFNYRYYDKVESLKVTDKAGYNYRVVYRDRVARRNPDYYKTVAFIYNEINGLVESWGIKVDKTKLATNLFVNVYTSMQTVVLNKDSITPIMDERTIKEIVSYARPQKKHLALLQKLMNLRLNRLVYILVWFVLRTK